MKKRVSWDFVKDLLLSLFTVILVFAWVFLMALLISFVAQAAVHFTIEGIWIASYVAAGLALIYGAVRLIRKYIFLPRRLLKREEESSIPEDPGV